MNSLSLPPSLSLTHTFFIWIHIIIFSLSLSHTHIHTHFFLHTSIDIHSPIVSLTFNSLSLSLSLSPSLSHSGWIRFHALEKVERQEYRRMVVVAEQHFTTHTRHKLFHAWRVSLTGHWWLVVVRSGKQWSLVVISGL